MERNNKYIRRKSNVFLYFLVICLGFVMARCEEDSDLKLELAVNSNQVNLKAEGGATQVMVYSTGQWSATFKEPVKWASIDKLKGEGNSSLLFSYSENLEASRKVELILTCDGKEQVVVFVQAGITPSFKLPSTAITSKEALPVSLDLITNLKYTLDEVSIVLTYDDELSEQWVTEAHLMEEALVFYALENTTGADRMAQIQLLLVDGVGAKHSVSTRVTQKSESTVFSPEKEKSDLTKLAATETVTFQSNITYSAAHFLPEVLYQAGVADWIVNPVLKDNTLTFDVTENNTGAPRSATIRLKLENKEGVVVSLDYPVVQSDKAVTIYSFADLRAKVPPSGEYSDFTEFDAIEGIVISDAGNPNMETNPQQTYNKVDNEENEKTAYIQSLDGSYGFRIKTPSPGENTFVRYSRVILSLKGIRVEKEWDPERYTLWNVSPQHIVSVEPGTAGTLPAKVRSIAELTDNDLYTQVSLKEVEVSLPYGTWTNVNWGYLSLKAPWNPKGASYVDAVPTGIRDTKGGYMNVLTNAYAPWCRTTLPTGSGTIKGIVTHSRIKRFAANGDIGRYSVRPLTEEDIQLNNPVKSATLVEWNWMTNGTCSTGTITRNGTNIPARIGQGNMTFTSPEEIEKAFLGAHSVCNSSNTDNAAKGPNTALTISLAINKKKWYDKNTGKGEGFVFNFSTAGVSGKHLSIHFSQGGGSGSNTTMTVPVYWNIEYSTDGINYTVLPNSNYSVRPLTGWNLGYLFACPGMQEHAFELPASLFGQANVSIRLVPNSDICGSNTDMDGGESGLTSALSGTAAIGVRLGVVSFKYNQ